jgi:phenylacetate-CoA ligase
MKKFLSRLERRLIKAKLARSKPNELVAKGEKRLPAVFRRAATQSSAYRTLLAEAGIKISDIQTPQDVFARCPVLNKANTFHRFDASQLLCTKLPATELASVLTSSGQGGGGFALGLVSRQQARQAARLIDLGLELAFDIDKRRTLMVNCLPMGVTFASEAVCVANVSVREDMACAVIQQAGALFEQIILCGDPLFLKRLCDYSQDIGLDWRRYRVHVILGEETFPETFRDYLAQVLGIQPDDPTSGLIGSSMGMGELGLNLFNETRETVALRRACIRHPELLKRLTGIELAAPQGRFSETALHSLQPDSTLRGVSPAPTFLVYNPLRTVVEVVSPDAHGAGDLLITMLDLQAPIPLIRYATGDRMQRIPPEVLASALNEFGLTLPLPSLPVVALHGRAKDVLPGGGHIDLFKAALYQHPELAREMSGAHRLSQIDGGLHWEVQAGKGQSLNQDQAHAMAATLCDTLAPQLPGQSLAVEVHAYDVFAHGKTIDYERKFMYWQPAG